jgi:non-homologous end joining protein Ku
MSTRPYATDVKVKFGMVTVTVDCMPVKISSTGGTSFVNVCPECVTKPTQQYVCADGHGPFTSGELAKARKVGKEFVLITDEEVAEIRKSDLVQRVLNLKPCPREQIEAQTRPGETQYRLKLTGPGEEDGYSLLRYLADNRETTLYGVCKLTETGTPTPFRLEVWNDQIVMQSLLRPQNLTPADACPVGVNPAYAEMGAQLLEKLRADFSADDLADERVERIQKVMAEKTVTETDVQVLPELDLLAALEASLAKVA